MRAALLAVLLGASPAAAQAPRWWKGNLHAHTLWSDGDDLPENVAAWYKSRGYHFLALSDHNTTMRREKRRRGRRLTTLPELQSLLEEPGRFILIPSEEVTDRVGGLPVHLNAFNLQDHLPPLGGGTVLEALQNALDAIAAQRLRTGIPMFLHVNHPNFGWAVTAEDLARLRGGLFFEAYNAHPGVRDEGDETRPSVERLWDIALALRLGKLGLGPLYGLAVDDAHDYIGAGEGRRPGRGWIWVRAPELSAEALAAALEAGDFYASSGVTLREVSRAGGRLAVEAEAEPGVEYRVQFIGTRRGFDAARRPFGPEIGEVLAEARGPSASYSLKGDELYVRARVVSTKLKAQPRVKGEVEQAWTQPLIPEAGLRSR